MAMQYDGKTYRNLQEQVAYLTGKWQELANEIDELRAQIPSKMIVEELPEEGDPLITYYVGPKGTAPNQYYEVWIWVQEEEDGPFVWRELEDTDQVDLSGYLPIQDEGTTYPQAYIKAADGSQAMFDVTEDNIPSTVVKRTSGNQINTALTPVNPNHVTSKKYVDDKFVAKVTTAGEYLRRLYGVLQTGDVITQELFNLSTGSYGNAIPQRDSGGQISLPNQSQNIPGTDHAISKRYADDQYLAKQTGSTVARQVYTKDYDGSQMMLNVSIGPSGQTLAYRDGDGRLKTADPSASNDAANKAYVDAAVGQLLYLHDIEIIVTVDATNKLYIKAYLINGSSTAITSIDRATFKRMDVQYGAFGPNLANVNTCAVTKCPDSLRQDEFDEPFPAYLYQYISGGSLVSGVTTYAMTVTVTDSVITDSVITF